MHVRRLAAVVLLLIAACTAGVMSAGSASAGGTGLLTSGSILSAGQSVSSNDATGQIILYMQTDGNLVLYQQANGVTQRAIWGSGTSGHTGQGVYAKMQTDGNLVIYTGSGTALWATNTYGHSGAFLKVQDDGALVVYSTANAALWSSGTVNDILVAGATLASGQYLYSQNRAFKLIMQSNDGNLVLYPTGSSTALWSARIWSPSPGAYALMQASDGNFVVYSSGGSPLYASNTTNHPGEVLKVVNGSNANLYLGSTWELSFLGYRMLGPGCRFDPANDFDGLGVSISSGVTSDESSATINAMQAWDNDFSPNQPQFAYQGDNPFDSHVDLRVTWADLAPPIQAQTVYTCGSDHFTGDPTISWNHDQQGYVWTADNRQAVLVHEIGHALGLDHDYAEGCNGTLAGLMYPDAIGEYQNCNTPTSNWTVPQTTDFNGAYRAYHGQW